MKICAYVQKSYAKANYKNECLDTRQFVGLRVVIHALETAGYSVEWAGIDTVHLYDVILVSLTADCDWWTYVQERIRWRPGNYKVIVGGAGVLHVTPFLPFGDYFSLGRGEKSIVNLIHMLAGQSGDDDDSIITSATFSPNKQYRIRQTDDLYAAEVEISDTKSFRERAIGCNHKCLFCGYTWHRKPLLPEGYFEYGSGLFDVSNKERAMLDWKANPSVIDWSKLRSTAIDGMSERLRFMVNKRISKELLQKFITTMISSDARPHQVKFFNIVGYPTETSKDWSEFVETISAADRESTLSEKQWSIVLNATPFRPMPATPMACAPMSKKNYRGKLGMVLGRGLKGNLIYQGKSLWCVEGMGTDSLSTVMLSAIVHRGSEHDTENIIKLCCNNKFWKANTSTREATLEKYFDMDLLFGEFSPQTLPSRYLRSYCAVEKTWERPAWKEPYVIKAEGRYDGTAVENENQAVL